MKTISVAPVKGKAAVMGRYKDDAGFAERECCICGRVFIPAVEHVFRVSGKWCCTYPCYIKLRADIDARAAAERARKIAARKAHERKRAQRSEKAAASKNETSEKTEGGNGN